MKCYQILATNKYQYESESEKGKSGDDGNSGGEEGKKDDEGASSGDVCSICHKNFEEHDTIRELACGVCFSQIILFNLSIFRLLQSEILA